VAVLKLYGSLQSGHSYKVRLMLLLSGVDHVYTPVDISIPRNKRPIEFQQMSPFGEVPVLVHDGVVLAQSNAILLHLARTTGHFSAKSEHNRDAIISWLFWEANRIGRSYPNLRYCRLFDKTTDPGLVAWFHITAEADLTRLNTELSEKPYLLGDITIADISCAGYLLYGDNVGLAIDRWPHVGAWLDRIRALPGWQHPADVMGKA
jgi:glutathione S-transferase